MEHDIHIRVRIEPFSTKKTDLTMLMNANQQCTVRMN